MAESTNAYVSVGSNIDRERNVRNAIAMLHESFGPLRLSSVYESDAVGFNGDPFFNLAIGFCTADGPATVVETLRRVEDRCGRVRAGPRFGPRTLDLDLLLYGDQILVENGFALPRAEILTHAFVLAPLAEIAGELVHPVERRTIAALWATHPGRGTLDKVTFDPDPGGERSPS